MKKLVLTLIFGLASLAFNSAAFAAGDKGTAEEAVAMVKKAAAYMKANGKEKAFAEISNTSGQFKDRDLYVAALDLHGKTLAHGANAKMVDKVLIEMKDADGKPFIKEFIDLANSKGKGWVDYKWPNPVTKAIDSKSTYVEKFDDVVLICGIYK